MKTLFTTISICCALCINAQQKALNKTQTALPVALDFVNPDYNKNLLKNLSKTSATIKSFDIGFSEYRNLRNGNIVIAPENFNKKLKFNNDISITLEQQLTAIMYCGLDLSTINHRDLVKQ